MNSREAVDRQSCTHLERMTEKKIYQAYTQVWVASVVIVYLRHFSHRANRAIKLVPRKSAPCTRADMLLSNLAHFFLFYTWRSRLHFIFLFLLLLLFFKMFVVGISVFLLPRCRLQKKNKIYVSAVVVMVGKIFFMIYWWKAVSWNTFALTRS